MGNEMGNNNTSGFQEESNTTAEAPEKSLQEAGHADDPRAENHENFTNSVSDDPKVGDNHADDQKSGEREQEAEVFPPSNGTDKALHESLQQDDSNTTYSAESEQSHQKVENSASDDPKTAEDAHEEREQDETEAENHVAPPTESKGCDESTLDDPAEVGDVHAVNLVFPERDQEEIEVPPPSISNAADSPKTSPKEIVHANNMKEEDHINLQTETKVYLAKEESNTTAEAPQKSLQEAGHADDVKAENNENFKNSASDDPKVGDNHVDDQKSGEGEKEAEVLPPSNDTDKALQEPLQQDDSNTTHSAESEQSHQKVENSVSNDPKTAEDVHEERVKEETEADSPSIAKEVDMEAENHVSPPTESKGCDEQVVSSTLDDPAEVGDVLADNLVLPERDQEEIEEHLPSISNATDSPKMPPREVVHANDIKEEDHINPQTETKVYLEKGLSLATDDSKEVGDAYVDNQMISSNAGSINCHVNRVSSSSDYPEVVEDAPVDDQNSGKEEQEESQVHHPTNSNELEKSMEGFLHEGESKESNEEVMNLASDHPMQERDPSADGETSEHETEAKPAESLKVAVESNGGNAGLEENHFGVKGLMFEEQTSINTAADEETAQNPQKSGDLESHQHESPEVLAEPSTQSGSESPQESNNMLSQIDISYNQSESDFLSKTIPLDTPKGAFGNCNEDLSTKMSLERTDSSESLPEEKCMVLTEETKLVSKEPANQNIKNEHSLAQIGEKFLNESMIKVSNTSEVDSIVIDSNQEANEELMEQFTDEITAVTSQSPDNAASIIEPILEMKLIARPARDLPPLAAKAAEIKIAGSGQCTRDDASRFSSGSSGAQSDGRSSTESNPEIHSQMRKSPSFSLDLLTEARAEETEQAKVRDVKPEKSDSEKLRTPFLGFLKDEEGKNTVITPNAEENHIAMKPSTKEVMSSPAKAKSKRKPRPFLFGTCICCAAVIN